MNRIILIADHYRGGQERNLEIITALLSPTLKAAGLEIVRLPAERQADWPTWEDALNGHGASILSHQNLSDTLVIGFEISPLDIKFLHKSKTRWINLEIHPLRFMNDLYFNVSSSFDFMTVHDGISDDAIKSYANIYKICAAPQILEDNSAIIIGQSPKDKSVYFDKSFKSLLNYIDEINSATANFGHIYYKPHPYATNSEIDDFIINEFKATPIPNASIYDAFSTAKIQRAIGISSSVLYEAPYFNIDPIFLDPRSKKFGAPVSIQALIRRIETLTSGFESPSSSPIVFAPQENFLRNLFGNWSYPTPLSLLQATKVDLAHAIERIGHAEAQVAQALERASIAERQAALASEKASQAECAADSACRDYKSVVNSRSWRITAPLRWTMDQTQRLLRMRSAWTAFKPVCSLRRTGRLALQCLLNWGLRHPRVKSVAMRFLKRFPRLYSWLIRLSHANAATLARDSIVHNDAPTELQRLSPHARKIFANLNARMAKHQQKDA